MTISRRTLLRGIGVAMALPLLESMGWAAEATQSYRAPANGAANGRSPIRLLFLHTPYGYGRQANKPWFWPQNATDFSPTGALSPVLEALRPAVNDCLLIDRLNNPQIPGKGGPGHAIESCRWLTCADPANEPGQRASVNLGISADQFAAERIGVYTALPSLELATRRYNLSGTTEGGFSAAYNNTISYRSATQALPSESSPRAVFQRLFASRLAGGRRAGPTVNPGAFASGDTGGDLGGSDGLPPSLDQSMLDLVMSSSGDLRKHVSRADQRVLDEYLDGVRALEKRVVAIERQQAEAARAAASTSPRAKRAGTFSDPIKVNIPEDEGSVTWSERLQLMADLSILAFQTDITRIITLPFSLPYDGRNYPEIGFRDNHHAVTHDQEDDKNLAVDRFNITQFVRIIEKMRAIRDGNGTLLDNSIVVFGSGMRDWSHNYTNRLPTLVAGRGGGTIRTGRMINADGTLADLYTAILARAGCVMDKPFGNGTKMLPDLA